MTTGSIDGSSAALAAGRAAVARVLVADEILRYIVDIAIATRNSPSLQLGVSPRGTTALMGTARAWAWLSGRSYVTPDDVGAVFEALQRPAYRAAALAYFGHMWEL